MGVLTTSAVASTAAHGMPRASTDAGLTARPARRPGVTDAAGAHLAAVHAVPVANDPHEVLALVGGDLGAGESTGSIFPRFA